MVGIVFCNDLDICPYAAKYIYACENNGIKYEVIIWNRAGNKREFPNNYRVFNEKSDIYIPKWKKIGAFIRFSRFLNRTIKEQKYDKLIMLTTLPAVLCYKTLTRDYKGKYIFDFRDLSFEKFRVYLNKVKKICDNSYFTCISSPEFSEVLGNKDFVVANNFRYADLEKKEETAKHISSSVNLLHIGITRGEDYNKRLVDVFGNDERFNVYIVGSGNDTPTFIEYAKPFSNIHIVGTYNNEDKKKFINNADMLLYYYPCDFNCNRALANKYYDGLIYKKPLLGNIKTYSGKRLMEKNIGISLDLHDNEFADKVYTYMVNLDTKEYASIAENELENILLEDDIYLRKIDEFLKYSAK